MAHAPPPIAPEQRGGGPGPAADPRREDAAAAPTDAQGLKDHRDRATGVDDGQPGDAGVNTDQQGRFGDIKQNTTHQGHQQDR